MSVSLQKGGIRKTTVVINLADVLAARGNGVLLVDLDQQGNVTEGVEPKDDYKSLEPNIGDVLIDDDSIDVREAVCDREGFDVLPFYVDLDDIEDRVWSSMFDMPRIRRRIVDPPLGGDYDYAVIDSPLSLDPLFDAVLIGTGNVIVPLLMNEPSVSDFERMSE